MTTVAAGVTAAATTWATRTAVARVWRRSGHRRDLGGGRAGRRRRHGGLGRHLLLEPPGHAREPVAVGDPRRAPLERALQPVDRAATAGGRRASACSSPTACMALAGFRPAADRDGPGREPALPVLDPHRDDRDAGSGSRRCSTRRRTTACTTAATGSYIDRNHGSILIVWDRLFGTFQREDEPVVYGLTTNIDTFNPVRIATHEHADILRDVARAPTWRDRLRLRVPGPGLGLRAQRHVRAPARRLSAPSRRRPPEPEP